MAAQRTLAGRPIRPASSTVASIEEIRPASSIVKPAAERIAGIERRRTAVGWSHNELLRRAGVIKETWQDLRAGRREPRTDTLDRLEAALAQAPGRKPPQIVKAFHRLVMIELCRRLRAPIEAVLATDFSVQRPRNAAWLQAARIKRMAIYITAVELELENAELARALGDTRQNVKQARDDVFDWMDTPKIGRVIAAVAKQCTGRVE